MKHCPKCDLDFPVSYKFCGSCGGGLPDSHTCQNCGEVVDSKWGFCTGCGKNLSLNEIPGQTVAPEIPEPLSRAAQSSFPPPKTLNTVKVATNTTTSVPLDEWYADSDLLDEPTERTVTAVPAQDIVPRIEEAPKPIAHSPNGNGKTAPTLTMLSGYGQPEIIAPTEGRGLPKVLVGVLVLAFFVVVGFGTVYWWTHRASAAHDSPQAKTLASEASSSSAPAATSAATTTINSADEEWKRLKEKRIAANPSDASEVMKSLEEAEKQYPSDYRFPYERAKLSIKGITSHHEAFGALAVAAEKAMANNKAQEMFDSLMADKDGDFWKLARGHREWQQVLDALSKKDKSVLNNLHHG